MYTKNVSSIFVLIRNGNGSYGTEERQRHNGMSQQHNGTSKRNGKTATAERQGNGGNHLLKQQLTAMHSKVLRRRRTIFISDYYQVLIRPTTHLPTPAGWNAQLAWARGVYIGLTCPRLLLDTGPGVTRTHDFWVNSRRPYDYATEPYVQRNFPPQGH